MKTFDRRKFFVLLSSAGLLSACGVKSKLLDTVLLDNQVENTLQFLYNKWPEIKELSDKAFGLLVIPKVSEASLFYGGSFGKGALIIDFFHNSVRGGKSNHSNFCSSCNHVSICNDVDNCISETRFPPWPEWRQSDSC